MLQTRAVSRAELDPGDLVVLDYIKSSVEDGGD